VGVQEVRWDTSGIERAGEYTSFYGKGNENREFGKGFYIHKRIMSAVKRIEFASNWMCYIILTDPWCNVIVLNIHAPTKDKIDDAKYMFYVEREHVFDIFHKYHMKILLDFNAKVGGEDISNQ
jgi:hypothetical protein